MTFVEINFDGLIGPTHNYGGLSLGNVASHKNAGGVSRPRAAALQGLGKMRALMDLGLRQGFLPPHDRPSAGWLRKLGFAGGDEAVLAAVWAADPVLLRNASSASAMWTANAATVSPAPDTRDGRCHLTVANLSSMLHRTLEAESTERSLRLIFGDDRHFAIHAAVPPRLGDEGAANYMRMAAHHGAPGIEIFVYGEDQRGGFPARQNIRASQAVARLNGLDPDRSFFARQSDAAIQAGAFHNDVVAVANENVLFAHEQAFEDKAALFEFIARHLPQATIIEVPASVVSLQDAIASYLFNSQLVTLPQGGMALVLPEEARETASVHGWLQELVAGNGPIRALHFLDVRESMRNGGGPACLRLRVAVDEAARAAIDQRFLLDEGKWEALHRIVETHWPEAIGADDLGNPSLWAEARAARAALLRHLNVDL
ncbi:N-succinylarginine dihydrolase [Sphingoaurantiacus capsulatus]|uniref:N-succinylarginine dihydrolase n=1 Tax=Sphingoaurantiacus capsulatus TaxID=1771310 RepID=A0ABV7XAQ1_9SPHN